ncbi:MAG: DNA gyrase subunit A [Candidatus Marinamargulisbacteria bacterium]|jgi:DNA gyrase subunit A
MSSGEEENLKSPDEQTELIASGGDGDLPSNEKLINIEDEMKSSYLEYAMSVIVGRALPDVRDGLKPVHRRILYSMYESGYVASKPYKKCARIVGDVLGRYHPHGDTAVYDSLVRMAQDFSLRYMLIDGQGNYGSVDGDNAAAMRYTEAKMSKISMNLLEDIEKETVDFTPNFDESLKEPSVLPARLPTLLLNGTSGIAVGMATNIPPHNLNELVAGVCALVDNPDLEIEELMTHVTAPDFPTGGTICGTEGLTKAYHTGRGSVVIRAKTSYEESRKKGKEAIIVHELPYQVNKANLIIKIAELVQEKKIPGISDLRDESDRKGMRIYIELKRDASREVVLNQLFKHTQLQNSFGMNMVALAGGVPKTLNLKQILSYYLDHRRVVITRRTEYDLRKAQERLHILEGLRIALDNIDAVIKLIRASENAEVARKGLIETFKLSERQANAILEMRLQRLTGLERGKIENEYSALVETIKDLQDILANKNRVSGIIKEEHISIREKFGDERKTVVGAAVQNVGIEDLIPRKKVAVLISRNGFVKRMPLSLFKSQLRGGRGVNSMATRDQDRIEQFLVASTHDYLMCFTDKGRAFKIKTYQVPEASKQSKGVSMGHFLNLESDEKITTAVDVSDFKAGGYLFMTTQKGVVKKTELESFVHFKNRPIIAINLDDGDKLKWVRKTQGDQDIVLVTSSGMAIRFQEDQVRAMGRSSRGVRGIRLRPEDELVSADVVEREEQKLNLLIITKKGYGKNIRISEFRCQARGGIGVKSLTFRKTVKGDRVVDAVTVLKDNEIMIVTNSGTMCRQEINKISTQRRVSQGVRIMNISNSDEVVAVNQVIDDPDEDEEQEGAVQTTI